MRKVISLVLTIFLLIQTVIVPASISAASPSPSSFTYDQAGNLTSDGERTITWDASGMPSSITKGNTVVNFIYDGSGQRIGKIVKVDGKLQLSTIYFGSLEKEINYPVSTNFNQSQPVSINITKYYFANSKRIAQRKNNDLTFIAKDHLSSSTLFTDSSGNKKDALLTYFPYGNERPNWDYLPPVEPSPFARSTSSPHGIGSTGQASTFNPPPSNHLYTDQIKDPETNLYYYNARYYSPQIGMFVSPDNLPDKFTADNLTDKLNRYSYVKNNPVVFNDPSGHWPVEGQTYQGWPIPLNDTHGRGPHKMTFTELLAHSGVYVDTQSYLIYDNNVLWDNWNKWLATHIYLYNGEICLTTYGEPTQYTPNMTDLNGITLGQNYANYGQFFKPQKVEVTGDITFKYKTNVALSLLDKTKSFERYKKYLAVIKEGEIYGGAYPWLDPPLIEFRNKSPSFSDEFYADEIAHEVYHIFLYNSFQQYRGKDAEIECLKFQLQILEELNADPYFINYIKSQIPNPTYQDVPYEQ